MSDPTGPPGSAGPTRRGLLASGGAITLGALGSTVAGARAAHARTGPAAGSVRGSWAGRASQAVPDAVAIETVATGLAAPVGVEFPAGDDRAFVVDQVGQVRVVGPDGLRPEPFLDVSDRMVSLNDRYDERGLLGLAFHPDFPEDRRLFVRYSAPPRAGTPDGYDHTFVLAAFRATGDLARADPDSERALLEIPEPQSNHNAGAVAFGPDGYLYVATGDGGGANDRGTGHVADWYDGVGGGNGQDVTENLLGSVLRIDVDGGDEPYGVPADNPLVGREGLDEHWAWGFRNPWRMSFADGDLYVADVGQNRFEEVSVVEKGGNYGWNVREGTHCFGAEDCPDRTPADVRGGEALRDPIIEYAHSGDGPTGIAVIGGYRYRGDGVPGLRDRYVFADWRANGRLFVATPADDGLWPVSTVPMRPRDDRSPGRFVLGFGRDDDGELYVLTTNRGGVGGRTGAMHRLVDPDAGTTTGGGGTGSNPGGTGSNPDGTDSNPGTTDATTAPGQPGFGTLAALGGLAGAAGYALRRRLGRED